MPNFGNDFLPQNQEISSDSPVVDSASLEEQLSDEP